MSIITSILFLVSLAFFVLLSIKSKSIRTYQFQISLFIGLYVLGEIIEIKELAAFLSIPESLGSQIHVGAIIFLTSIIWIRFYHSEKAIKNLVDTPADTDTPK
jgi:D-alanyl-lipoteichoic acid acyltransferase DltB (MBOAT superfamily)